MPIAMDARNPRPDLHQGPGKQKMEFLGIRLDAASVRAAASCVTEQNHMLQMMLRSARLRVGNDQVRMIQGIPRNSTGRCVCTCCSIVCDRAKPHDANDATLSETSCGERPSQNDSSLQDVFLSYSGAQKDFAEALYEVMKNSGYSPFFDKDRDSLPLGEPFPPRIIKSAENCRIAVVVLSREYFSSKWPMLELALFVNAQKTSNPKLKILPLFYGCEVSFLKNSETMTEFKTRWESFAREDSRIVVTKWTEAYKEVLKINGLIRGGFENGTGVQDWTDIVGSLYNLCPPNIGFMLHGMQGRERICDVVEKELERKLEEGKAAVLGVHGVSGMGKTLICQALCNRFHRRFLGRVLYVDFSNGNSLELKKKVLIELTNFKSGTFYSGNHLDSLQEKEVDKRLARYLKAQDVFLAIDNLSDALNLPTLLDQSGDLSQIFGPLSNRSMLFVTSRSKTCFEKLKDMNISEIDMPSLNETEAMDIFIHEALRYWPSPSSERAELKESSTYEGLKNVFTPEELQVVKTCVSGCVIRDNTPLLIDLVFPATHVYHPMALQALGKYLARVNPPGPLEWVRQKKIPQERNPNSVGKLESIYKIFEKAYDNKYMMDDNDRLIFMDVAVFAPRVKLWHLDHLCSWLKEIFPDIKEVIRNKLDNLEDLGFLEINRNWWNTEGSVKLHDLYKGFAHWKLKKDESKKCCVYHTDGNSLPFFLESTPPGRCWPDLRRIELQTSKKDSSECLLEFNHEVLENLSFFKIPQEKLGEWMNVQVLHLAFGGETINIGPLKCLRDLLLEADQSLKTFDCSVGGKDVELRELRFVKFICWEGEVRRVPDFTAPRLQQLETAFNLVELERPLVLPLKCGALTILKVTKWHSSHHEEELNLQHLPNLTDLEITSETIFHGSCTLSLSGLSALTKLRRMYFRNLPFQGPFLGLENLKSLKILVLRLCWRITAVPGLDALTSLQHLSVSATGIVNLNGLDKLSELRELYCMNCGRLESLPDLSSLQHLRLVLTKGCDRLLEQNISVSAFCFVPPWKRTSLEEQKEDLLRLFAAGPEAVLERRMQDAVEVMSQIATPKDMIYQHADAELEILRKVLMDPRTMARQEEMYQRVDTGQRQFEWTMKLLGLAAYGVGGMAAEYFYSKFPLGHIILRWLGVESLQYPGAYAPFSSWQNFLSSVFWIFFIGRFFAS